MFGRDKKKGKKSKDSNRYRVNIRAEHPPKVISIKEARKKRGKEEESSSFWQSSLGELDIRTPWVLRLLAVVFILILSMLVM